MHLETAKFVFNHWLKPEYTVLDLGAGTGTFGWHIDHSIRGPYLTVVTQIFALQKLLLCWER